MENQPEKKTLMKKSNIKDDFFGALLLTIFGFLYIFTFQETTPLWVRILVISPPPVMIFFSYIVTRLVREERVKGFFSRIINVLWLVLFFSICEIPFIIMKSETAPLWVLLLFISLLDLSFWIAIITRVLIRKERGRRFFKEAEETLDKENRDTKREEMNRSIRKIKKIKTIGGFFVFSLILILISFLFLDSLEKSPLWISILVISPSIVFIFLFPKMIKLIREERRKRFLEDTDETFDIANLMKKHKAILKDLKRNPKETDE
jgi:hypothetical protein